MIDAMRDRSAMKRRVEVGAALDVLAVLLFVIIGRRNHHEGGNVVLGALRVAAPFLIALAVGWGTTRAWRTPMALRTGMRLWVCTVVLGLLLRRTVFDRGTAIAFVIVTTITLAVLLVGWRAVARQVRR
jgi:hypothetical protein